MPKQDFPVQLSKRSAQVIRQIMRDQKMNPKQAYVRVGINDQGHTLDITEQLDPRNDTPGRSHGLNMVIHRDKRDMLDGIVIDYAHSGSQAGFLFEHPAIPQTAASDPGGLTLSKKKLHKLHPDITTTKPSFLRRMLGARTDYDTLALLDNLSRHLKLGDSRAAIVLSLNPLVVAAYTDEMDCVALLRFEDWLTRDYKLTVGSKLITVNTYSFPDTGQDASDLLHGPEDTGRYTNFYPLIADFVAIDEPQLAQRKQAISEDEWERTKRMGEERLQERGPVRDGKPLYSHRSA